MVCNKQKTLFIGSMPGNSNNLAVNENIRKDGAALYLSPCIRTCREM